MAQQLLHDSGAASYCFEPLLRHPLRVVFISTEPRARNGGDRRRARLVHLSWGLMVMSATISRLTEWAVLPLRGTLPPPTTLRPLAPSTPPTAATAMRS